ncbi:macrolide ABC transporter ATP-binding protein [Kitasatospora phosalacinea]|uniref:Macrolide ABC transporter ATP-binding protein n=1 Tax=Kitasatospora phosalacinea TaxID=2065 RepID=A0A9W6Q535_9ACTN|nr:ABC transporter ATP-binding protein [Kitasatospora phosalacinea]GLW68588.1 macrolide ABC transporter ATP-binding protein [Kitasatospora phosalacinea]
MTETQLPRGAKVVVTDVRKTFRTGGDQQLAAVDGVSLRIEPGRLVALTGPSGSGKSTLLHLLGAIERPDSGSIEVAGTDIAALGRRALADYRRGIGIVFQRFHLLPALTALDNVIAPVLPVRTTYDKRARARELLTAVGLAGREDALPSKLSGGQQQRVAIARALINSPALLLADEPTGNLDSRTGAEVVHLLKELRTTHGTTMVIATHDQDLADGCEQQVRLHDGRLL